MSKWGVFAFALLITALTSAVYSQSQATVVSPAVSLLEGPGSGDVLIEKVGLGTQVIVENQYLDDKWTLVSVKDKKGWIKRNSIRIRMDDPWRSSVWLLVGRTKKVNDFSVRFYLNTSQIIRLGNDIRFWTRVVPDNKEAYFKYMMEGDPSRPPAEFKHNSELWEGDCSSGKMKVRRSLLYWKRNVITSPKIAREDSRTSSNSAARVILDEACTAARR